MLCCGVTLTCAGRDPQALFSETAISVAVSRKSDRAGLEKTRGEKALTDFSSQRYLGKNGKAGAEEWEEILTNALI